MTEKTCPICGTVFVPTHGRQKYDKPECGQIAFQIRKKRPPVVGECAICGEQFTLLNSRQVTCGREECKKEYYRIQKKKSRGTYYNVGNKISNRKRKKGEKTEDSAISPSQRWERMTLTELSKEIARMFPGMSFGQVRILKEQGKLPEDFGLGCIDDR